MPHNICSSKTRKNDIHILEEKVDKPWTTFSSLSYPVSSKIQVQFCSSYFRWFKIRVALRPGFIHLTYFFMTTQKLNPLSWKVKRCFSSRTSSQNKSAKNNLLSSKWSVAFAHTYHSHISGSTWDLFSETFKTKTHTALL